MRLVELHSVNVTKKMLQFKFKKSPIKKLILYIFIMLIDIVLMGHLSLNFFKYIKMKLMMNYWVPSFSIPADIFMYLKSL